MAEQHVDELFSETLVRVAAEDPRLHKLQSMILAFGLQEMETDLETDDVPVYLQERYGLTADEVDEAYLLCHRLILDGEHVLGPSHNDSV